MGDIFITVGDLFAYGKITSRNSARSGGTKPKISAVTTDGNISRRLYRKLRSFPVCRQAGSLAYGYENSAFQASLINYFKWLSAMLPKNEHQLPRVLTRGVNDKQHWL